MFGVLRPQSPSERVPAATDAQRTPPPPHSLAPMPPTEFKSREGLLASAKDWASHQGFAVVIARSRFNRLWLKCDRGGTYENRRNLTPEQRKRKRGDSRLLGCPFRILATVEKDGRWRIQTDCATHNHPPSEDLSLHPTLRRMTKQQLDKVHEMFEVGKSPADTMKELKETWPDIKVLTRDVYNARKKYKTQKEEDGAAHTSGGDKEVVGDPNGVFPGPDKNGRWAWVPEGEEVTSRYRRRRRRTAPGAAGNAPITHDPALDPQLQDPLTSTESAAQRRHTLAPYTSQNDSSPLTPSNRSENQSTSAKEITHPRPAPPSPAQRSNPQQPSSSPPAHPLSPSSVTNAEEARLRSRIDQLEREQREQKNMLTQILGAVKEISASAAPSPT